MQDPLEVGELITTALVCQAYDAGFVYDPIAASRAGYKRHALA